MPALKSRKAVHTVFFWPKLKTFPRIIFLHILQFSDYLFVSQAQQRSRPALLALAALRPGAYPPPSVAAGAAPGRCLLSLSSALYLLCSVSASLASEQQSLRARSCPGPPPGLTTYPLLFSALNGLFAKLVSFEEILGEAESPVRSCCCVLPSAKLSPCGPLPPLEGSHVD